ncbi:MAG: type II toxin-antitoxin system VapC family toxin [Planctomycetota bacterium]|nr:type II toxin-antitoxin system VapC family toxin [Planctomycetota bacterium]
MRLIIDPDVALRLAAEGRQPLVEHELLAPTLLRSQVLALLYRAVRDGAMGKAEADAHLRFIRGLRIRLLGDRVLQDVAWKLADQLGWADTYQAEYVALTRLQGDALVTLDKQLAGAVQGIVKTAPFRTIAGRAGA